MKTWTVDLSRISHGFEPDQEMVNFFSCELEKGRTARPPYSHYVTADSLAVQPWMPTDEPHEKALDRWRTSQKTFGRFTGNQDLSTHQYFYYRMRFILAGDLTDAWADFGGLTAQINMLGIVLDMAITDHAGIALTYDYRIHQLIRKLAHKRSTTADYFSLLSSVQADVKAGVIRDFEFHADAIKKEKEKEKTEKEKARKEKGKGKGGKGKGDKPTDGLMEIIYFEISLH